MLLPGGGTMRGFQMTLLRECRNTLRCVSLARCVGSCAVILPGVSFLTAETFNNDYSTVVRIPKATELEWIFTLNEEENEIVRSEFYYEQVRSGESSSGSCLCCSLSQYPCLSVFSQTGRLPALPCVLPSLACTVTA